MLTHVSSLPDSTKVEQIQLWVPPTYTVYQFQTMLKFNNQDIIIIITKNQKISRFVLEM